MTMKIRHHHSTSSKICTKTPLAIEQSLQKRGYQYVIGCDEVGRGAIAGPVLAASCCIMPSMPSAQRHHHSDHNDFSTSTNEYLSRVNPISEVADSKILTPQERHDIYGQILQINKNNGETKHQGIMYAWTYAQRSAQQIAQLNILQATMECFRDSIQELIQDQSLPLEETYAIVDGNKTPKLKGGPTPISCRPYVNADGKVYTVSVASILAKCERDRLMEEYYHELYPEYGFDVNKGYSTRGHIEAIHKFGPCPIHRPSFKPLKGR